MFQVQIMLNVNFNVAVMWIWNGGGGISDYIMPSIREERLNNTLLVCRNNNISVTTLILLPHALNLIYYCMQQDVF